MSARVSVALARTPVVPAGPSVSDAQIYEASGWPLGIEMRVNAPAETTVWVRYLTSDATTHAGSDR